MKDDLPPEAVAANSEAFDASECVAHIRACTETITGRRITPAQAVQYALATYAAALSEEVASMAELSAVEA